MHQFFIFIIFIDFGNIAKVVFILLLDKKKYVLFIRTKLIGFIFNMYLRILCQLLQIVRFFFAKSSDFFQRKCSMGKVFETNKLEDARPAHAGRSLHYLQIR